MMSAASCGCCERVTLGSLLEEMGSREGLTRHPEYVIKMVSSHDRRSVSPDQDGWFANDDYSGFERYDTLPSGRVERVLFDEQGAGAVVRRGEDGILYPGEADP